jgi:hypothetical protein
VPTIAMNQSLLLHQYNGSKCRNEWKRWI